MAQFVVRNLEDDVKARLKRRAAHHRRSMEEEVRHILRDAGLAVGYALAPSGHQGLNSHVTRYEPPKDRLSKSLNPQNAVRFGWQAWRAARARCPRFACHA